MRFTVKIKRLSGRVDEYVDFGTSNQVNKAAYERYEDVVAVSMVRL